MTGRFQRTDRRTRGRRAPAPQVTFAPGHIPEHRQDDWYDQHFRHIGGNTRLLRRAAALRLVQTAAGGSLAEAVWARVTQGEHLLAPRIIENQMAAGDPARHRRRDNMWHFYNASPAKPHYAALRKILNAHAGRLAAATDRPAAPRPAPPGKAQRGQDPRGKLMPRDR